MRRVDNTLPWIQSPSPGTFAPSPAFKRCKPMAPCIIHPYVPSYSPFIQFPSLFHSSSCSISPDHSTKQSGRQASPSASPADSGNASSDSPSSPARTIGIDQKRFDHVFFTSLLGLFESSISYLMVEFINTSCNSAPKSLFFVRNLTNAPVNMLQNRNHFGMQSHYLLGNTIV
jgi:hypothetical protein